MKFNEVLMDFAVFYCILLYFRSLRIPRTFEGRVEQFRVRIGNTACIAASPNLSIFFCFVGFFQVSKNPSKN
jgi:hypothetical protein